MGGAVFSQRLARTRSGGQCFFRLDTGDVRERHNHCGDEAADWQYSRWNVDILSGGHGLAQVERRQGQTGRLELAGMLLALVFGIGTVTLG